MIQCYDLVQEVRRGVEAVGFLVKMARRAQLLDEISQRVYPGVNVD